MDIGGLFDTAGFPPRWLCGEWSAAHGWTHITSDVAIAGAYTAIPIVLGLFVFRRPDVSFRPLFWLFCAFIVACGVTHLIEATIFWQPWYRLSAAAKVLTAVVSWGAVGALIRYAPQASRLPNLGQLRAVVESTEDAIFAADREGRILTWNPGAARIYGFEAPEIVGRSKEILDANHIDLSRIWAGESIPPFEMTHRRADGSELPVSISMAPVIDGRGRVVGVSSIARDITERRRAEKRLLALTAELERQTLVDPLTELENRRGLVRHLERIVDQRRRTGLDAVAVLVDLDDFKLVNDAFGHAGGDVILKSAAARIRDSVRPSDLVTRIGGDEFLVLLPETHLVEGRHVAERIRLGVVDTPVELGGRSWGLTVSVSIAPIAADLVSVEEILDSLRYGLARSKERGKNSVTDSGGGDDGWDADAEIARALSSDSLEVYCQSIRHVRDESLRGYEMLVRGPEGPYRNPDDLFRLSIERDLLSTFDLTCLRRCIHAAADLPAELEIHVNVFPSTLLDVSVDRFVELCADVGGPARFCLELSEKQFLGDPAALRDVVRDLQQAGFRVAVDDVGYGRSALESLVVLEPDIVKIDRLFVGGVGTSPALRRRLERLLRSARCLAEDVVVEGVEGELERDVVARLGVATAQGFLWDRPSPVASALRRNPAV